MSDGADAMAPGGAFPARFDEQGRSAFDVMEEEARGEKIVVRVHGVPCGEAKDIVEEKFDERNFRRQNHQNHT